MSQTTKQSPIKKSPTKTSPTKPRPTPDTTALCTIRDCPLNEAGITHLQGIYKHNGQDQGGFDIAFGNSNPPEFIWRAWDRFGDLERMVRKGRKHGENVVELEKERAEMSAVVARFLDYHCGCKCFLNGSKH
jgi:hypothetical protein